MKSLYKYMELKGMEYRVERFGGSYFYDTTLNVIIPGAVVAFDYINEEPRKLIRNEKILKGYCKRYNYSIKEISTGIACRVFWIVTASDQIRLNDYYFYQSRSVEECEKYIHEAKRAGVPDIEINETCKKIMAAYERDYRDFIKNARKAGA